MLSRGRSALISELQSPTKSGVSSGDSRTGFERGHSDLVDVFLRARLEEIGLPAPQNRDEAWAIVAVGGYGRRELCLHSDVDLLIISRKTIPSQALDLAQPLFLSLWDQGYDLGHGFRTIRDCLDLAASDYKVLASLLDLRHIAGDPQLVAQLRQRFKQKIIEKRRTRFLQWLEDEYLERRERSGDGATMLEPQLKDGLGGLRDYHRMLWLAKLCVPEEEAVAADSSSCMELLRFFMPHAQTYDSFAANVGFLFSVRNQLHRITERKNDILYQELQPRVAVAMGYEGATPGEAAELFLARLHHAMTGIKAASRGVWQCYARPLLHKGPEREPREVAPGIVLREHVLDAAPQVEAALENDPLLVMRLFAQSALHTVDLCWQLRERLQGALHLADKLARTGEAWDVFLEILQSGNAALALGQMMEIGFLDKFLPAFGAVRDLVQFDGFHSFPVGWHTIQTIHSLERLSDQVRQPGVSARLDHLARLWQGLQDRRPVLLAALFHDLGKGGADHEIKGAAIARDVLERYDMDPSLIDTVEFLVREHVLLVLTATRSDLGEESAVLRCANQVGSVERLRMLYLLSYADARATGPKAWNDWIARLLAELYDKTRHMLQEGRLVGPHAVQTILKNRDEVRALLRRHPTQHFSPEQIEQWLENMPPHYVLRVVAKDIVRHLNLVRLLQSQLAEEGRRVGEQRASRGLVVMDAVPVEGSAVWELAVAAKKHSALVASIAGVLSLHDLNIFAADVFIWSDNTMVALFRVSAPPDPLYTDDFWARVRGALKFAMTGKLSLDYRLDRKRQSMLHGRSGQPGPVSVQVDNESTDFFTVIEVLAGDRPGLLYEIAHCLQELHVEVHMAKVATHEDQVADYFYVRDTLGQKIDDSGQLHEIREALLHRLTRAVGY